MHIILEKRAIIFKLNHDSLHLNPLQYFIKNSFKNVKHFSNYTVISADTDEAIKKRYLLKWAYKIYQKKEDSLNSLSFKHLSKYSHFPIYIVKTETKSLAKTISITVDHINSDNELRLTCNQYNIQIIQHFKILFKDSMLSSIDKRIFKITIKTKDSLIVLKSVLSRTKISNIPVIFITHGLNFNKLHAQDTISQEQAYIKKLKRSYKVLSITTTSTTKEIKQSYKKMLRKYHPDRVGAEGSETIKLYTRRFQVIQEAYELIKEHHKVA